ncbi:MAG TPA: hypothetical protein VFV67_17970 [Actinophytocola sp.]|uniref:hypothetical protein n=1 Tax=Actinophytocola sp. TaxID=1872138 RepID=UPI002DB930BA|nr:hypothetical protein [Actinophytocola sp.]HEU5472539.1 hypothetical protein [Actinophytocola sp.]
MKPVSRALLAGAGLAVAGVLAVAAPAAAVAPAPAAASDFSCTASTSGNTVTGSCQLDTRLGTFGATFTGTMRADGYASGTITMRAGILGTRTGNWSGGPFTRGSTATVNFSIPSPLGPIDGSFQVDIP